MSSIGNAIKLEQELASGTLDSEDDLDFVDTTKRPTTRKLASDYTDIVRQSLSRNDAASFRAAMSRQKLSSSVDEKKDESSTTTPRRQRPLWQPMVGLFSQLIDHFTSPSPHKHVTTTTTSSSSISGKQETKTTSCSSSSWHIGASLSATVSIGSLPPVVNACRTYLCAKNRLETEGIFRVPGRAHIVSSIRDALSKNEISPDDAETFSKLIAEKNLSKQDDHEKSNVYNVATLMKSCLAELPEPVVRSVRARSARISIISCFNNVT